MSFRQLARAASLALLAVPFVAAPGLALSALDIVAKSQSAGKSVCYRGIKYADIAVGSRTVRAQFRVAHQKPDRTRIDYLTPEELAGFVTIDCGGDSWRYVPSRKAWMHAKWSPVPQPVSLTLKNYNVVSIGKGQVAGRAAYVIKLTPKKKGNPSETVWVDTRCYLPLKSELRNSAGSLVSVSAFREISFVSSIPSSTFGVTAKTNSDPPGDLGFTTTKPSYVPKGYTLVQTQKIRIGNGYAAHLMYTNGVNTISIFEKKRGTDSGQKPPGLGKWANVLRFDRGQITYTIISDISRKELDKIAASIK